MSGIKRCDWRGFAMNMKDLNKTVKKILFLGGAHSQVPAIRYAVEKGLYVITADYKPDNPGHQFSHEYHNISTVDRDEILKLSRKLQIDAISPYASDPAAPTASWVAEKMGLVGGSYGAVEILSDKGLFRQFLSDNGFNTPWFITGDNLTGLLNQYDGRDAILKPADSSGSKGLYRISCREELINYYEAALAYSRSGKVIVEEFFESKGSQVHGEGFVVDGKIVFLELGDQIFSKSNNLAPFSTIVPSIDHLDIMPRVYNLVKDAVAKSGYVTGGLNIEVLRDINNDLYLMEIGARSGGNYMTHLMTLSTGFNLIRANIDSLFNESINIGNLGNGQKGHFAQVILHSRNDGYLSAIRIPTQLKQTIIEEYYYSRKGDRLRRYKNSADVIGVVLFKLDNNSDLDCFRELISNSEWVLTEKSNVPDYYQTTVTV